MGIRMNFWIALLGYTPSNCIIFITWHLCYFLFVWLYLQATGKEFSHRLQYRLSGTPGQNSITHDTSIILSQPMDLKSLYESNNISQKCGGCRFAWEVCKRTLMDGWEVIRLWWNGGSHPTVEHKSIFGRAFSVCISSRSEESCPPVRYFSNVMMLFGSCTFLFKLLFPLVLRLHHVQPRSCVKEFIGSLFYFSS